MTFTSLTMIFFVTLLDVCRELQFGLIDQGTRGQRSAGYGTLR